MKFKQILAAALLLVLSLLGASAAAITQDVQYRLAHANGQGTLKVGQEQFQVNGVIVKLLDDRKAEITLISDITFFISGTWSQNGESKEDFDLQITGGATPGGLEAAGRVTLSKDVRLTLKGKSRTTKKTVEVNFAGK